MEFTYFEVLYSIPILLLLNYILIKISFVKIPKGDPEYDKRLAKRKKKQNMLILFRSILIVLVIVAISDPIIKTADDLETDPYVKIIWDQSSSMDLFSTASIEELISEISTKIDRQKVLTFGDGVSPGSFLSANADEGEHVLFITDGWDNINGDMSSAINYVNSLNSTVHTLRLDQRRQDSPISIKGPSKVIESIDNAFQLDVNGKTKVKLSVDGEEIYSGEIEDKYDFKLSFDEGSHIIKAEIANDDYFKQNNVWHKTVHTIPKPKVLFIGPANSLYNQLTQKYAVNRFTVLPNDFTGYHLVIVYDKSVDELGDTSALESYVIDGGGLIVFGGNNAFDRGGYEGSRFEKILPVSVASAQRKRSPSNIVLVVDVSESGGDISGAGVSVLELQKSVAHEFVEGTAGYHNLGVVAFAYQPFAISSLDTLVNKKQTVLSDISRLQAVSGGTYIAPGLRMAKQFFVNAKGDKNIILISDGKQFLQDSEAAVAEMINIAADLRESGVKIHVIHTGEITFESLKASLEARKKKARDEGKEQTLIRLEAITDEEIEEQVDEYSGLFDDSMRAVSEISNGFYFKLNDRKKLNIMFSDPDDEGYEPQMLATFIDSNHFISRDLSLSAKLPGYNNVVPKSSARVISTLDTGEPVITVRRYGLGRTLAVTAYNPPNGLGELMNHKEVIGRMMNYGIGDPSRLEDFVVDIPDGFANLSNTVTVRSSTVPTVADMTFSRTKPDTYEGQITQPATGVYSLFDKPYAINYDAEYLNLGNNEDFVSQIRLFGGTQFNYDADQIIEYLRSINVAKQVKTIYVFKYFIMAAVLIYLMEIFIRRYLSKQ